MEKLFIYGTLQDEGVQEHILGRVLPMQSDLLIGYTTKQIEINDNFYPIAVPNDNSDISGKVIEVTEKELLLLDDYETDAYQRVAVTLTSGQAAWVYSQPTN